MWLHSIIPGIETVDKLMANSKGTLPMFSMKNSLDDD